MKIKCNNTSVILASSPVPSHAALPTPLKHLWTTWQQMVFVTFIERIFPSIIPRGFFCSEAQSCIFMLLLSFIQPQIPLSKQSQRKHAASMGVYTVIVIKSQWHLLNEWVLINEHVILLSYTKYNNKIKIPKSISTKSLYIHEVMKGTEHQRLISIQLNFTIKT